MWEVRVKDLTGNFPVLGVVVDVMKKTGVTEIQVSSLWRNSKGSPHKEGLGIDITAATRDGVTVRFNNSTVGPQSKEAMRIRDGIYNAFVTDERVSQALDPWEFYGFKSKPRHNNTWKTMDTSDEYCNYYYEHRHHLHITIR
jgi:hypothetical protein